MNVSYSTERAASSRFGIDEEVIPHIIEKYRNNVDIIGLHVYTGSQILVASEIVENFANACALISSVSSSCNIRLSTLVFGGGFGVSNGQPDLSLDLNAVESGIKRELQSFQACSERRVILELGRYLVATSGIFISKVIDTKQSRGKQYILTDGGINNFLRPAFMKSVHPIRLLNKMSEQNVETYNVGGPLCTPLDEFCADALLPKAAIGDLVGVFNAGAYGHSMSFHHFLGHASPAEVLVDGGAVVLLRNRVSAIGAMSNLED